MEGLEIVKNKIAIIGFGVSGKAIARYFLQHNMVVDVFEDKPQENFDITTISDFTLNKNFTIYFSNSENEIDITTYDYVIVSPGVHDDHKIIMLAKENNIEFITDINAFSRIFRKKYPQGKIISITGSNGKSTTVSLLYEVLIAAGKDTYLGGNIGVSPLDFLNVIKTQEPIIVLESSSYQLEYLKEQDYFDVACVLNLSDNHLDRYHGKKELYGQAKLGGINSKYTIALVNFDDEYSQKYILPKLKARDVIGINFADTTGQDVITFENDSIYFVNQEEKIKYLSDVHKMHIKGLHNIYNTAFVCGILHVLNIDVNEKITKAFFQFKGLKHRLQFVRTINDVQYINDSKSTSPDATIKALDTLGKSKNIVLISGGVDKDISYDSMAGVWSDYVKSIILLPGDAADKLKTLAQNTHVPIIAEIQTMDEAVKCATENSIPGDIVLLSPSTASFASFKSFEDRGEHFIAAVQNL